MNSELMKRYIDYLNNVRNNNRPIHSSAPTLMVYDSFRGHLERSVKKKFKDNGYDLAIARLDELSKNLLLEPKEIIGKLTYLVYLFIKLKFISR